MYRILLVKALQKQLVVRRVLTENNIILKYIYADFGQVEFNSMKQPTDATVCSQFYSTAKFTLHVSGATHTHHQEYNVQLYLQPLVQTTL